MDRDDDVAREAGDFVDAPPKLSTSDGWPVPPVNRNPGAETAFSCRRTIDTPGPLARPPRPGRAAGVCQGVRCAVIADAHAQDFPPSLTTRMADGGNALDSAAEAEFEIIAGSVRLVRWRERRPRWRRPSRDSRAERGDAPRDRSAREDSRSGARPRSEPHLANMPIDRRRRFAARHQAGCGPHPRRSRSLYIPARPT